jgi:hypothetical protein
MARIPVIAPVVLASLAVTGCGGSTRTITAERGSGVPPPANSQLTKAQAAKAYLAAIDPANRAIDVFVAKIRRSSSPTQSELTADARPAFDAIGEVEAKLSHLASEYPPAATDLKAQITAIGQARGDFASIENSSAWVQQLTRDTGAGNAAGKIVRSDLGLPITGK